VKKTRRPVKAASRARRRVKTRRPKVRAKARPPRRTQPRPQLARTQSARPRAVGRPPLDRARRVLSDDERLELAAATSRADRRDDRLSSSAKAGHDGMLTELKLHTEASPALTAGDVDARWQDAYAVGDEAPGGDNPTPDQDRVDEIGSNIATTRN
jgi:hypothetical protein